MIDTFALVTNRHPANLMALHARRRSSDDGSPDARQNSAGLRASPLRSQQVLQSCIIERRLRQEMLQLRIFVLKRLLSLRLGHVHPAELSLPFIDAGIADVVA